jgi:polyisoprenoid-binding protein YceI
VSKRTKVVLGAGAVVVLLVGFAGWWFLIRDDAPAAVSLEDARETIDEAEAGGSPSTTGAEVSGTWSVDPSIGSFDDFSGSLAGYRIDEELSTIGSNTAVGRTPDVTGDLTIEAMALTAAMVTVDLTSLESDEGFRDGAAQRTLETDQFPEAVFTTTEPVDLGAGPGEGTAVDADVAGELTLHGVTQPVVAALEAELVDGVIIVTGSIQIALPDYGLEAPVLGPVVSVSDQGEIEFQLFFTPS